MCFWSICGFILVLIGAATLCAGVFLTGFGVGYPDKYPLFLPFGVVLLALLAIVVGYVGLQWAREAGLCWCEAKPENVRSV